MKWFRNQIHVPNLTPHSHTFDSLYGCEHVSYFFGPSAGVVLYCSCGVWRFVPER